MNTPVVIVGGGPAGTSTSLFLSRKGIPSVIIEKDTFPRYHVGESMTGECGTVVRELGLESDMMERGYPIKRGVTVFGVDGKNSWFVPVMSPDEEGNLVPNFTWQVPRSDFDALMLEKAVAEGATLLLGQVLDPILDSDGRVRGIRYRSDGGKTRDVNADVVVDASGQATFLANAGIAGLKHRGAYDRQIAIFSQVRGATRDDGPNRDDTLIFYQKKYHWGWFIPIDRERVSVGIVSPSSYYLQKKEDKPAFLRRELRELNSELSRRIEDLTFVEDVRAVVNYSYQVEGFAGDGFLCVGDSHRFVDPIFSFGLFTAVKEGQFAADSIEGYLGGGQNPGGPNPFFEHMVLAERGQDVVEDLVDAFWHNPLGFAFFVHHRYREQMIDALAGRIYDEEPSLAVAGLREQLGRQRDYRSLSTLSSPEGSRFQPNSAE